MMANEAPGGWFQREWEALPETVRRSHIADLEPFQNALNDSSTDLTWAVGSGGSLVTADFLRLCRACHLGATTICMTPLEMIAKPELVLGRPGWLFSASGINPDSQAVGIAARHFGASRLDLLTLSPGSPLIDIMEDWPNGHIHLLRGQAGKDGFLATHSLLGSCLAILGAFPPWSNHPALHQHLSEQLASSLSPDQQQTRIVDQLSHLDREEWLVLHDPLLSPAALALETNVHELGLAAIQRTDFRNFAHGRHTGLLRRRQRTLILSLVTPHTAPIWKSIKERLPPDLPMMEFSYHSPGPWGAIRGIADALFIIGAASRRQGIDAAKPGVPEFGKAIHADQTIMTLASNRRATIARKACVSANTLNDGQKWAAAELAFRIKLRTTCFAALLLDFDGTIVSGPTTKAEPWIGEFFSTLLDHGCRLGIASGRGGSLTAELRALVPERHWHQIPVGYYNGGMVLSLAEEWNKNHLLPSVALQAAEIAMTRSPEIKNLVAESHGGPLQLVLHPNHGVTVELLARKVCDLLEQADLLQSVRVTYSGHTVDVHPTSSSKCHVLTHLRKGESMADAPVLCIGDQGGDQGNDFELLGTPFSLSLGKVCGRTEVGWNLLPPGMSGPEGLLRYCRQIHWVGNGYFIFEPV